MNEKEAKILRKICSVIGAPRIVYRKTKLIKKRYNLDLQNTVRVLEGLNQRYHEIQQERRQKAAEKEQENGKDSTIS